MRRSIYMLALAMCSVTTLWGQGEMDALKYSSLGLKGSARYMGMGGAFGALGGDISSLTQNPAGIGVYRSSELVTTFGVSGISSQTQASQGYKNNETRFAFDNIGIIGTFNTDNDKGLVTLNFGFAYNRQKSFDRNYRVGYRGLQTSLSNYMASVSGGITKGDLDYLESDGIVRYDPYNSQPWLSVLGYESLLFAPVDPNNQNNNSYYGLFGPNSMGSGYLNVSERGHIDEYTFNFGGNVSNQVYWGIGIGITDFDYRLQASYGEDLGNTVGYLDERDDQGQITNVYNISSSNYEMRNVLNTSGTGVNVKFGLIARITPFWRLGLAFHTPTYYSMKDYAYASVDNRYDLTNVNTNEVITEKRNRETPEGEFNYKLSTPWRLMASTAFILGKKGILSFDYEYTAYDKMRLKYDDGVEYAENDYIRDDFKAGHTFKVGGEYRITSQLSGRLGYAHQLTPVKKAVLDQDVTIPTAGTVTNYTLDRGTQYYTAGLGYRFGMFFADVAYVHSQRKEDVLPYSPYLSNDGETSFFPEVAKMKTKHNNFVVTLGLKF